MQLCTVCERHLQATCGKQPTYITECQIMDTVLFVQSSIQSYFYGHWLLETLSDPLLLQRREIAVNKVNIWSHSYSASCTKQLKDIHISVYLLVVKLWFRVWAFNLALTTVWEWCATNSSIVYRNYTGSCILSQHALPSFHAPGEIILMPLRCFMNTAVIPLNDRWSEMEEEEKFVVLAFIFTAARP